MSLNEVIAEPPDLTFEERDKSESGGALDLEGASLLPAIEALVEERRAGHHSDPTSSATVDGMKLRLRHLSKS